MSKMGVKLSFFMLLLVSCLSGCSGSTGDRQETAQEDAPDCIYVPEHVTTSSDGGYELPEGFWNPKTAGDSLYFCQRGWDWGTVSKAPVPKAGESMELAEAQALFTFSTSGIDLDGGDGLSEEEVLNALDRAMEAGEEVLAALDRAAEAGTGEAVQTESPADVTESGKKQVWFDVWDYAVDQEGNLYLALDYNTINGFLSEYVGCLACKMTPEGTWVYRHFFQGLELGSSAGTLAADGEGGMYLLTAEGILEIDGAGRKSGIVQTEGYKGDIFSSEQLLGDQEGHAYYLLYEDNGMRWRGMEISREGGPVLKETEGLSGTSTRQLHTVCGGKVYLWDEGVYEYDPETADTRLLFRWGDSNLLRGCVWSAFPVGGDRFLAWYDEAGEEGLYLLTRTPADELPEKETVVLAALDADLTLQNAVVKFNRQSQQYKVTIEDYGYSTETMEGAVTRRDAALVSSQPPDLVELYGIDLNRSVEKGMLADLSPFLEESSVLDREDFLENALEGYTIGGKLVGIPVRVIAHVLVGRASQAGELGSWTMEDVYSLEERFPEQTRLVSGANYRSDGREEEIATRDYLLSRFCSAWYLEEFVDWEGGTCSFDSEGFRKLLEWAGEHGREETGNAGTGPVYLRVGYMPEDALFLDGLLSFENAALWDVQFGGETCILGYPTADGRGSALLSWPTPPIGITAKAGNSEGAWAFLEYYIARQCSEPQIVGLSTSRKYLKEQMEDWIKTNRLREYADSPFMLKQEIGGEIVPVYGISQETAQKIMDFLEGLDFTPDSGRRARIIGIVLEEAEGYYSGDKSLEEVTAVIQNRVQLYLNEGR